MAGSRSTTTGLTIALSIFVMLAFALGITTYLYFDKAEKAEASRAQAASDAAKAETKTRETADEMTRLREIIGVAADMPAVQPENKPEIPATVESELKALVAREFPGFQGDPLTYVKLLEWLRQEFRENHTRVKTSEEEKKALAAQKDAEVASAEKARQDAVAAAEKAAEEKTTDKADFDAKWTKHEEEQTKVMDARRVAEERARDLASLKADVEKGLDYMPPARKAEFRAAIEAGDLSKQLDLLRLELRVRAKEIETLNAVLAKVRVADPNLQKTIANARSEDDRIDGFNGHVVSVDARTGTALISCRTTAGVRPGLVLQVFPPGDPRPEFGSHKGVVEISEVQGPTLLKAVLRREDPRDPILTGDGVASSLWAGGGSPDVVIVGFSDADSDGRSDLALLGTFVERAGGRIVDSVTPGTSLVVDLGQPPAGGESRDVPGWPAEAKRRTRNLDSARTYNVRVTGIEGLLSMLGLEADSFLPGNLPKGRAVGRLPARQ